MCPGSHPAPATQWRRALTAGNAGPNGEVRCRAPLGREELGPEALGDALGDPPACSLPADLGEEVLGFGAEGQEFETRALEDLDFANVIDAE